jgi:hypothetical protein
MISVGSMPRRRNNDPEYFKPAFCVFGASVLTCRHPKDIRAPERRHASSFPEPRIVCFSPLVNDVLLSTCEQFTTSLQQIKSSCLSDLDKKSLLRFYFPLGLLPLTCVVSAK